MLAPVRMKAWPAQGRVQVPVCHTCKETKTVKNCVSAGSPSHLWRACILTGGGGYLRSQQAGAPAPPLIIRGPYGDGVHSYCARCQLLPGSESCRFVGRVATTTTSGGGSSQRCCCGIPTGKTLNDPLLRKLEMRSIHTRFLYDLWKNIMCQRPPI